ncbi:transcription factor TFIIE beta subunit, TFIIEB, Tfa2 [Elasticomyces elasticus]|uniref:Transcription factor TFIIE beta subunit, TFIIEB, Tfa2 n=1 Tax=Exophiala sideris TaxID=1016849 RepID=A0ABR0J8B0_9EURO|nr:transcription factor TFIIE beta subunit, TFIIEB, Tfa2 [Elasticomyces elasticus]KAK5025480.1 transcription factor TFIIE beta subunit, TFIIEB, Tfa2 [Exophiala sideris]KAK5029752.1 transcription factor TFIIE beta subunit, TFIIEB, Tfa2 [Exophiala sideris]KAK5058486.1 transcription factor TFIIE beta subunit, TFIIEB, Tfa2 [Exophiala sideris]KAK5178541.1 transcription factor TFIIE beta subunit, TFIIEB, Tfa2 [Eurotiomycetes sp. CCFEE 6388]
MSSLYGNSISLAGSDARTNVIFALERLRDKFPESISWDDLVSFVLPVHKRTDDQIKYFRKFLSVNPKVVYEKDIDSYKFKPLHSIASADDLLKFLQNQDSALGINVRDLKDGWNDVEDAIDRLEAEHKLLVVRNKKDNHPRMVWADDPSLDAPLDQEFKDLWSQIALPSVEDTIKALRRMNHKTTGEPARADTGLKPKEKKKKVRRGNKVTNTHMQGLFRDYSDKRPQGSR